MSDQHEVITEHEARIAELEQQLASLQRARPVASTRVSRRRVAALGVVVALLALPGVVLASHQFPDVPSGHPFHDDIDWLADHGIAQGFADGTYRPGEAVTRQAMAAFLHRLSNELELVNQTHNPDAGYSFLTSATCPDDKRAIAGGAYNTSYLLMTGSYPSGDTWNVRWVTDGYVSVDPTIVRVYALCAPRL